MEPGRTQETSTITLQELANFFAPLAQELTDYLKHHAGFREIIHSKVESLQIWDDAVHTARLAALQSAKMENEIAGIVKTMGMCLKKLHGQLSAQNYHSPRLPSGVPPSPGAEGDADSGSDLRRVP